jgi:hypothetical protein
MDDAEADLRAMKITNWKISIEDKLAWKKVVEQVKTHPVCMSTKFHTCTVTCLRLHGM